MRSSNSCNFSVIIHNLVNFSEYCCHWPTFKTWNVVVDIDCKVNLHFWKFLCFIMCCFCTHFQLSMWLNDLHSVFIDVFKSNPNLFWNLWKRSCFSVDCFPGTFCSHGSKSSDKGVLSVTSASLTHPQKFSLVTSAAPDPHQNDWYCDKKMQIHQF